MKTLLVLLFSLFYLSPFAVLGQIDSHDHSHPHPHPHPHPAKESNTETDTDSTRTGAASIRITVEDGKNPWTNLNINNNPENFQFAIVTDRTGGHRSGVFADAVSKLNLLQPEFVMSVGDLIEGYVTDTNEINRQWAEFMGFTSELEMPFFYVPGNHDFTNDVLEAKWKEKLGRTYYHFIYKDVLFMCLNSEEGKRGSGLGAILEPQYNYIKKTLEENENVRWTLVFMHQPLWTQKETGYWVRVEQLLNQRKHTVFVGHNHRYVKYDRNKGKYFILATTGGGSELRGPSFGEFDHVVWVTMTDDGPRIVNLMLEGIWDEDIVTEDMASIIHPLLKRNPLSFEPIYSDTKTFTWAKVKLKLTNDNNVVMKANLRFEDHPYMQTTFKEKSLEVDPNSVRFVDVMIKSMRSVGFDTLTGLTLKCTYSYDFKHLNLPPINIDLESTMVPEKKLYCDRTDKKIKVDGKLKEWGELQYTLNKPAQVTVDPTQYKGPDDCSFTFDLRYDDDYLYFAAHIVDDVNKTDADVVSYMQDALAVRLDARPMAESMLGNGGGLFKDFLYIGQSSAITENGKNVIYMPEKLPEGLKYICIKVSDGYVVEIAVPISYMNEKQGGSWNSFRLNLAVDDYDEEGGKKARVWWKPDWRTSRNYIGSGTFFKR